MWGWVDAAGLEHAPHRGGRELVAEADEFVVDASVAPGRILGREAEDELADLGGGGWSSGASVGLCPAASDALSVPSQEGFGGDGPAGGFGPGECGSDGAQQGPVVIAEGRSCDLAA